MRSILSWILKLDDKIKLKFSQNWTHSIIARRNFYRRCQTAESEKVIAADDKIKLAA